MVIAVALEEYKVIAAWLFINTHKEEFRAMYKEAGLDASIAEGMEFVFDTLDIDPLDFE